LQQESGADESKQEVLNKGAEILISRGDPGGCDGNRSARVFSSDYIRWGPR